MGSAARDRALRVGIGPHSDRVDQPPIAPEGAVLLAMGSASGHA
jgi:hypothetical protein